MTEKELVKCYTRFNKKYFGGKLPDTIPIVLTDMSKTDDVGMCTTFHGQGLSPLHTIYLDKNLQEYDTVLKLSLLHELCHVKLYPYGGHGEEFDAEMVKLAFKNAFHDLW